MTRPADKIFPKQAKLREEGRCPLCGMKEEDMIFFDKLSVQEHAITGLCQVCQDQSFIDLDD